MELMQNHPIHVVAAWLGNTPKIAIGHCLIEFETDSEKARQEAVQNPAKCWLLCGADNIGMHWSRKDKRAG